MFSILRPLQSAQGLGVSEPAPPAGSKPGIDQLLIASALDADLRRQLLESPDAAFQSFDLTEEQKDLLRRPDHRLLPLLGAALAHDRASPSTAPQPAEAAAATQPLVVVEARTPPLPDVSLVLTLVPCAQYENGRLQTISYAVWVNPLPPDADPASIPPPPGAVFPGQPLTPLHAVIQVFPLQIADAAGNPQIGLSAVFRQSSNIAALPPPESAGRPDGTIGSGRPPSEEVRTATSAVRSAPAGPERYERLIDLMHVLRKGKEQ